MSTDHIKSEISAYLAGGLTEARNRQIEAHVAVCEKCATAMNKARSKLARQKREALKKASSDSMPSLFLVRQSKETGADRSASPSPWILVGLALIAGGSYWLYRHHPVTPHPGSEELAAPETTTVVPSTAAVSNSTAAASLASAEPPATPAAPEPSKPTLIQPTGQEWKGTDSGILTPRVVVIRNSVAWEKLWTEMKLLGPIPPVNFDQSVIAGIFAGEKSGDTLITIGAAHELGAEVTIPYHITTHAVTVSPVPVSHPYQLTVFPRTDKKIRLTEREIAP